jgi:hypothetical protein
MREHEIVGLGEGGERPGLRADIAGANTALAARPAPLASAPLTSVRRSSASLKDG